MISGVQEGKERLPKGARHDERQAAAGEAPSPGWPLAPPGMLDLEPTTIPQAVPVKCPAPAALTKLWEPLSGVLGPLVKCGDSGGRP